MSESMSISFICECGNQDVFLINIRRGGDSGVEHGIVVECDTCGNVEEITG